MGNPIKPTVFFSHSSADREVAGLLKGRFIELTGGTIDVFVSSDGQSIRVGTNWVHEVQQALERCKLMFVLVTPNSLVSSWITFEAGFAYSRGIQVVPIAMLGVTVDEMPSPLRLLQGYNVSSHRGLNNIVANVNELFHYSLPEGFTESDYTSIVELSGTALSAGLGEFTDRVEELVIRGLPDRDSHAKTDEERKAEEANRASAWAARSTAIGEILGRHGVEYIKDSTTIFVAAGLYTTTHYGQFSVMCDADFAPMRLPVAIAIAGVVFPDAEMSLEVRMRDSVIADTAPHRITARLASAGVTIEGRHILQWRGVQFRVGTGQDQEIKGVACVWVRIPPNGIAADVLGQLITLLFARRVLEDRG
ncbi:MAG: toll/interleukin-1 receptor domain-containing protein [Pseudomonadota bacterium]